MRRLSRRPAPARGRVRSTPTPCRSPTETTVLGDFTGVSSTHMGVTSEFFRRDDEFIVRTDGPDGQLADFEVRHTFGVYPLQQYLLELPGGRLQALSIAWDARPRESGGQRWFHLYPDERIDHRDELHWTGRQQNWNYMCADCHSTNLQKNYDAATDSYATSWSEISVGCEVLSRPGVRACASSQPPDRACAGLTRCARRAARRDLERSIPTTGNARRSPARRQHAGARRLRAMPLAARPVLERPTAPGEPFLDHYRPALLEPGLYHPDGQQRDEVYNWGSFLSSRMHAAGVTCSDCHEPHSAQLRAPASAVCSQCHLPAKYQSTSHHFHAAGLGRQRVRRLSHADRDVHGRRSPARPQLPHSAPGSQRHARRAECLQCLPRGPHAGMGSRSGAQASPAPKPGYQTFAGAFAAADRVRPAPRRRWPGSRPMARNRRSHAPAHSTGWRAVPTRPPSVLRSAALAGSEPAGAQRRARGARAASATRSARRAAAAGRPRARSCGSGRPMCSRRWPTTRSASTRRHSSAQRPSTSPPSGSTPTGRRIAPTWATSWLRAATQRRRKPSTARR